jgi:hypothetical protein
MMRWEEELELVQEEMERVKRFWKWEEHWWRDLELGRTSSADPELQDGLRAYARQQAELRRLRHLHFDWLWRHVPLWILQKHGPSGRRWYWEVVKPDESPATVSASLQSP